MSLQEKLKETLERGKQKHPPEKWALLSQIVDELRDSGIVEKALSVGAKVPEFTMNNQEGQAVSLSSLLSKGPVILSFYRGMW